MTAGRRTSGRSQRAAWRSKRSWKGGESITATLCRKPVHAGPGPIDSLRDYLGVELSPAGFEDAAEHFGIPEMAVRSHLVNHELIPRTFTDPRYRG